jgi:hypothetical protein
VRQRAVVRSQTHASRIDSGIAGCQCRRRGAEHLAVITAALSDVGAQDVDPQLIAGVELLTLQRVDPRIALRAAEGVTPQERRADRDLDCVRHLALLHAQPKCLPSILQIVAQLRRQTR